MPVPGLCQDTHVPFLYNCLYFKEHSTNISGNWWLQHTNIENEALKKNELGEIIADLKVTVLDENKLNFEN
jgi:hypothetical protein